MIFFLFSELVPALSVMPRKSSNAFMNFTVENGSPVAVVGYRCSGGSREVDFMTQLLKKRFCYYGI